MIGDDHRLTAGYLARHIPPGSKLGLDVAVLDIAQDFLLSHLEERGFFTDLIVFKGGTALRKFFAGSEGRFSTDLDLASRDLEVDWDEVAGFIAEQTAVKLGPFEFQPRENRGRWTIKVRSEFGDPAIGIKLDVGPPCWLAPEERPFVKTPAQSRYGFVPPAVPVMRLEEILAEKVARLTRVATARDASDLVWASSTSPHSGFSRQLVLRLAVLKVWVATTGSETYGGRPSPRVPSTPRRGLLLGDAGMMSRSDSSPILRPHSPTSSGISPGTTAGFVT